jgi:hypothetical protein
MKSNRIERKELDGTIDGTMTDDNEQRTAINNNCDDDGITKRSASASFVAMVYKKEERKFIFLLLHVFKKKIPKAATRATHYMIASSKTHKSAQPRC